MSPDNDEIKSLENQLRDIQLKLEESKRKESNIVKIKDFRILDNSLQFTVHPYREDVYKTFSDMNVKISENSAKIDPTYWDTVEKALGFIREIKIEIDNDLRKQCRSFVMPPNIIIKFSHDKNYFIFDNDHKTPVGNIMYRYTGKGVVIYNNKYAVLSSSPDIAADIIEQIRLETSWTIKINDDVALLINAEIEKRMKLEKIHSDSGESYPPIVLNGFTLRSFQTLTVEFLKLMDGYGIVGHQMGLGKTPCLLGYYDWYWKYINDKQKFVIVVPASLRPNWHNECKKFLNIIPTHISGSLPSPLMMHELLMGSDKLFIQNYESISASSEGSDKKRIYAWVDFYNLVGNIKFGFDEGHYMKNPDSNRSKACRLLKSTGNIVLTGTPMKNGPKELQPLIAMVAPEIAGTYDGWTKAMTYDNGRRALDPVRLNKILKRVMFRKLTKDVEKELPPLNRITLEYELSPLARKMYTNVLNGFYEQLKRWDGKSNGMGIQSLLAQLVRMKQVCSEDKIEFVADRARETYDSRESDESHKKVLVFSQFSNSPECVKRIHDLLNDGNESLYFTGNNDIYERQRIVDQFQNDDSKHFLVCSTKAASEGLNITAAYDVIFTDLMWTPADHQQAEGRAYMRVSDPHGITSTYIVAADTIEDDIVEILFRKMTEIGMSVDGMSAESIANEVIIKLKDMR